MTRRHLRLRRGTSLSLGVTARRESGAAIDLTGASLAWRIATEDRRATRVVKTLGSGVAVTDGPRGRFTVALAPADTAALRPGTYAHAAEAAEPDGTVSTVLSGRLELERDLP
ncbi:MAG: hypothetical protein QNJ67_23030 [Kiloniellales bacterium]|nr:hypothetical protein [Kiloniellales bacterium]